MNEVKKLAGQTAVYGMGTIVPKLLNFAFLTPYFARVFDEKSFGAITELYAYVVILNVIITFGMETGFFRFSQDRSLFRSVFTTAMIVVTSLAGLLLLGVNFFLDDIASLIHYEDNPQYITWFSLIIALDCISAIPFAKLRRENRARKFSTLKLINVFVNIGTVLFFISLWPMMVKNNPDSWFNSLYNPQLGVGYVFLANLIASSVIFLLLTPELKSLGGQLDRKMLKNLLKYSAPLVIVGVAGSINEVADKIMLKFLYEGAGEAIDQVGIYGANYRLAVIMTLFVQMFKYAFEPFLFAQKGKDSNLLYAKIMDVFVFFGMMIFLVTTFFIDPLAGLFFGQQGKDWPEGIGVVPVVMMANLFLGIYYSLSVWYKLTDLTRYAAVIALGGSVITIVMNALLIPRFSYMGSAWAHLMCYGFMMVVSWLWGRKYLPVPYNLKRIGGFMLGGTLLFFINRELSALWTEGRFLVSVVLIGIFFIIAERQLKLVRLFFGRSGGNEENL